MNNVGYDAAYIASLTSAGMTFVRSKYGISLNQIEDAKPEKITAGCKVLLDAMLERALIVN